MPELRHLIDKPTAKSMWRLKDKLEVLHANPLNLHKTAFLEFLRVKGEMLYEEAQDEQDIAEADAYLTQLSVDWKEKAKDIYDKRMANAS